MLVLEPTNTSNRLLIKKNNIYEIDLEYVIVHELHLTFGKKKELVMIQYAGRAA
jgi:hypothetical protein